ncbi:MAG: flagellar basal body P-ring protein FlgI [Janthinobacterium lividum]
MMLRKLTRFNRLAVSTPVLLAMLLCLFALPRASASVHEVKVRDITEIQGVRENQLIGYGLVVGLQGTGDRQQTYFTVQTLANILQKMGVQIPAGAAVVKNVAAVMITAQLPAFAEPGLKMDITVSSVGDAKSIEGGVLLMTALRATDGQVYAEAQGALTTGGYSEGAAGNLRRVNYLTVGRIPNGATIERQASVDLHGMQTVTFLLRDADFTAARDIADLIDKDFRAPLATAVDSRHIEVDARLVSDLSVPRLISRIQNLSLRVHAPARVVVNERTGSIVLGGDVLLLPVSVLHGGLQIQVDTIVSATPPAIGSDAAPAVIANTVVNLQDKEARSIRMGDGANVEELVKGLHAIGATSHDIISILQAIKAAGGLEAELEVI